MRLLDLEPGFYRWEKRADGHIYHVPVETLAEAQGVRFLCPNVHAVAPRDRGEPHEDGRERRCHTFITDGVIDFLGDCSHALAGQKHPIVAIPPQWRAEADPGDA